jgi:superfamily II DNA or RNA helicase
VNKLNWHEQLQFIDHEKNPRQEYIIKLIMSLTGNTMVLFRSIEHGTYLYEELVKRTYGKEVMYIDGSISGDDREKYRVMMEENDNLILVGSYGTVSTGISINRLHNIVFSSPSKSKIRVLQSIGRGLRKHETKSEVVIYDIVDLIGFFRNHYKERKDHYNNEKFPYTEEDVGLFSK